MFKARDDGADESPLDGVWFDDDERALFHNSSLMCGVWLV
jgi:hypothetical protein